MVDHIQGCSHRPRLARSTLADDGEQEADAAPDPGREPRRLEMLRDLARLNDVLSPPLRVETCL
ncbi:hypothetical protein WME76_42650 [Sorangium sp. So ce119]|uniref:hypothetical protein n=1 Tax=Sorangium sp. So ce119 TaxID=3133279 RepID=UPI003F5FC4C4